MGPYCNLVRLAGETPVSRERRQLALHFASVGSGIVIGRAVDSTQEGGQSHASPGKIPTVTNLTFDAYVLQAGGPIAVEFMSYGCAHCGALEPILQRVAAKLQGTEAILRVNVAVDQDLAQRYDIFGTPTVVMFLDGREVGRVEGPSPSDEGVLAALTQPFEKLER